MPDHSSPLPLPPDVASVIRRLDEQMAGQRREYLALIDSIASLPAQDRAGAWIRYWAEHITHYGDEEALVFLRSRGDPAEELIENVVESWRAAATDRVDEAQRTPAVWRPGAAQKRSRRRRPAARRLDIESTPSHTLRQFWSADDYSEWHVDATMLRTVEWCDIGEFGPWWRRLAREEYEAVTQGGVSVVAAIPYLFACSRSQYARQLLERSLLRLLDAAELPTAGDHPWEHFLATRLKPTVQASIPHASTLVFSSRLMRKRPNAPLLQAATETLLQLQRRDGAWPIWNGDKRPSLLATCMAIHALSGASAAGHRRAVTRAASYLVSQQDAVGYWAEPQVNTLFLTVLVMDALELAAGSGRTTLSVQPSGAGAHASDRRFAVGLTFPGELRPRVAAIADQLAAVLGRQRTLYDEFHTAEFARPNLDTHLQQLYHNDTDLIVVFICSAYASKEWPNLEWRAVRDLIKRGDDDRIMFLRSDDATLPGSYSIDGYVDMQTNSDSRIAQLILDRLGMLGR